MSNISPHPLLAQGLQQHQLGHLSAAIEIYHQMLQEAPFVEAYANLGVALRMQGHLEAAVVAYGKALAMDPEHVPALSNLGGAYRALGQLEKALPLLEKALALEPDFAAAHYNLGLVLMDLGEPQLAIPCFETTLRLEPDRVDAPFDRAVCLLQNGDWVKGFAAYESRFAYEQRLIKPYVQPRWDGSPLQGRTLLLYAEQGFGDTLQFIRYVSHIQKGPQDRIILECPPELQRLMAQVPGLDQVVVPGEALPAFDTHASLLSLPHLFQTTLETIPPPIPYPSLPSSRVSLETAAAPRALKIGMVWASGHRDVGVRNRTILLQHWLPLFTLPNLQFYSLQKGPAGQTLEAMGLTGLIEDLSPQIHDFADTAAFLEQLDLLITADTAIVHLAGTLNIPVWVLLPYGSEWRWLLNRNDPLVYQRTTFPARPTGRLGSGYYQGGSIPSTDQCPVFGWFVRVLIPFSQPPLLI